MRIPTGNLSPEDTTTYVEAAIARDKHSTELRLTLRRLQAKYRYGASGGVDPTDGAIQQADGKRDGKAVEPAELELLNAQNESAELSALEWQALLLQLRDKYKAPMAAFPDDNGVWTLNGQPVGEPARSGPPGAPGLQPPPNGKQSRKQAVTALRRLRGTT